MESSVVRKRVRESIDRAQRAAAARRAANHQAGEAWRQIREHVAIPLLQQVSQALKADGYPFRTMTPGETVRLASERSADDYIELMLDTSGPTAAVVAHISRTRGRDRFSEERTLAGGDEIGTLSDERLLDALLDLLPPFVER
jgi:hypothetical protein